METTVVTALYDIERETRGDGRSILDYLVWFEKTLKLNCPMVIFTEKKFESFILDNRINKDTKIFITSHEDIPYFIYKSDIEKILNLELYKKNIKDPNRVECILSMYNIIQYSKFEWLKKAIEIDEFNSKYFFWMDAGCSRFFQDVDVSKVWPHNYSILSENKFNIQGNSNTLYYSINDMENYIWDSNCILVGTLFGGTKDVCFNMSEKVNNKFEYYLKNNIINNEQIILGYIYKKRPELFNIYIELNGQHLPLFKKLAS